MSEKSEINEQGIPKFFVILIVTISLTLFLVPTYLRQKEAKEYNNYVEIDAKYLNKIRSINEEGKTSYYLKYEYTVNNRKYYYVTNYSTNLIPRKGDIKKIKYNPNNPSDVYNSSFSLYSLFQIIGVFILFVMLILLFSEFEWWVELVFSFFSVIFSTILIKDGLFTSYFKIIILILLFLGAISFISVIIKSVLGIINPIGDIKKRMELSKKIKLRKKEEKEKHKEERKKIRVVIINGIIIFLFLFFLPFILSLFINKIDMFLTIFSFICFILSFFSIFITNYKVTKIKEKMETVKPSSYIDKKMLYIYILIRLFALLAFGVIALVLWDPLRIFDYFNNPAKVKISTVIILAIITNIIYGYFNAKLSK